MGANLLGGVLVVSVLSELLSKEDIDGEQFQVLGAWHRNQNRRRASDSSFLVQVSRPGQPGFPSLQDQ